MKKIFLIVLTFALTTSFVNLPNWGKTGHRATAEIAEHYLTKKAKKAINQILDGESMALVANFGDDVKSDKSFDSIKVWHYVNIPAGKTYDDVKEDGKMDIIKAINLCQSKLKIKELPKNEQQFYLKMLIHLIGDLHQPMHVAYPEDRGGNKVYVKWFGGKSNLHRVWDSDLIDHFQMSYTELAANKKSYSKDEINKIQEGTILDWLDEVHHITDAIYAENLEPDAKLGYDYAYKWTPILRQELDRGGIRLAKVLNDLFK